MDTYVLPDYLGVGDFIEIYGTLHGRRLGSFWRDDQRTLLPLL